MARGKFGWMGVAALFLVAATWLYAKPPISELADQPPALPPLTALPELPAEQEEAAKTPAKVDLPPKLDSPPRDTPAPTSVEDEATIEQLLELRKQIGSPLKGTVLDGGEDHFADFLRRAVESEPKVDHAEPNNLVDVTEGAKEDFPHALIEDPAMTVVQQLRAASAALDLHAQHLETELPARARRMRDLADQLRREAEEIQELGM